MDAATDNGTTASAMFQVTFGTPDTIDNGTAQTDSPTDATTAAAAGTAAAAAASAINPAQIQTHVSNITRNVRQGDISILFLLLLTLKFLLDNLVQFGILIGVIVVTETVKVCLLSS
jgi:hypothetical protein